MQGCVALSLGSVKVGNLLQFRVVPQMFDVIVFACFGKEVVHHHRAIVHGNPVGILLACYGSRFLLGTFPDGVFHGFGHGFHLLGRVACGHYEELAGSGFDVAEVNDGDVVTLLFLDAFNDKVY